MAHITFVSGYPLSDTHSSFFNRNSFGANNTRECKIHFRRNIRESFFDDEFTVQMMVPVMMLLVLLF